MKRILFTLCFLWSVAYGQLCADTDTVMANSATMITATTVRINGTTSHFSGSVTSLQLKYVRTGQTDTVTSTGVAALRNLTGLQAATQYIYYYKTICGSGSRSQTIGPYRFTTLANNIIYVDERPTRFYHAAVDSSFGVPAGDTIVGREPSTRPQIRYKTSNGTFYAYYPAPGCACWRPLAIDSAGIIGLLDGKVDSVTVSGDSLFYWKVGVSYGYILPSLANTWRTTGNSGIDTSVNYIGTSDNQDLPIGTFGIRRFTINANGALGVGAVPDYGSSGNFLQTLGNGAPPGWAAASNGLTAATGTLKLGGTLTGSTDIDANNNRFRMTGIGTGSRFYLSPTLASASMFDITQKSSNGTDSAYFLLQKAALSASVKSEIGLRDGTNNINSGLSMTISAGIPVLLLKRASTINNTDYNLRLDAGGINMYAQNSTGTANTLVRAEPDSIVNKAYDASDASVYSYLNVYQDSIYGKVNGKIVFGSNWADQYANDSLFWRTTDRTGEIKIYPNEVAIYGGTKELEVTNSGIEFTLGSDATGDIWYRNSSGFMTRLPIGTTKQTLHVVGGVPAWRDTAVASGGSLSIGSAITSATAGSVLFAGTGGILQQKNSDFFYDSANNRLGIGTNSPQYPIHLLKTQNAATRFVVENQSSGSSAFASFDLARSFGADYYATFAYANESSGIFTPLSLNITTASGSTGGIFMNAVASAPIGLSTNNTRRMTITGAGNVGIGNTSPGEKLEVTGNVKASGKVISRNVIYQTSNASDAGFTAAQGTAYVLPDNTADRTITLPASPADGDIIRFYLPLTPSFSWEFNIAVKLPDNTTYTRLGNYPNSVQTIQYDGSNSVWRAEINQ